MPSKWPRSLLFALWLVLVLLLGGGTALALAQGPDLPYDEAEAQAIDRSLMCPVCPAETIDQAQVELARQMRGLVRDMLAQGAGRDEILDFFVERYGPGVLAAPPKSGANLLAWILPVAGIVAALVGALAILRSMTAGGGEEPATGAPQEDGLEPYLEAIDRDLSLPGGETRGESGPGAGGVEPVRGEDFQREGGP